MRELASVQSVLEVNPIENADAIEVATIQGWRVVVNKGEFKAGDLVVYIEVDSLLPDIPEFEFMRARKFRVRTIKLRGQVSQGICFPLTILPERNKGYKEGEVVSDLIGVTKYDPEGEKEARLLEQKQLQEKNKIKKHFMKYKWYRKLFLGLGKKKNGFPKFIKKTDETRIQKLNKLFNIEKDNKTIFSYSEKLDGQSGTYYLLKKPKSIFKKIQYEFGVCSRNLHLLNPDNSSYWTIAKNLNIKDKMMNILDNESLIVIQGEIIGEGIQGNTYKVKGYDFYVFNIIIDNRKLSNEEIVKVCGEVGLNVVPIIGKIELLPSIKHMVDFAKGKSVLNKNSIREGLVFRNNEKDVSFKVISEEYLLKIDAKRK